MINAFVAGATERLMAELSKMKPKDTEKHGFSVKIAKRDVCVWEVRLFGFADAELGKDLARTADKCVVMEFTFPPHFPFAPPFCRIVRPRFAFHTGHVTIGGSICTELLTMSGWVPQTSIEVSVCVRNESSHV
jgi:ubiquitin-conjugating enzyme E2 Q